MPTPRRRLRGPEETFALPYVFLACYTALDRIPGSLYEASGDSGAAGWRTFTNVVWPLSRQGALLGASIAFVLAFGDYITPAMVGGLKGTMVGSVVFNAFTVGNNWPLGATLGITILVTELLDRGARLVFESHAARGMTLVMPRRRLCRDGVEGRGETG
jgi:ABC-type spermidine/putrescine transport system permease subunit I